MWGSLPSQDLTVRLHMVEHAIAIHVGVQPGRRQVQLADGTTCKVASTRAGHHVTHALVCPSEQLTERHTRRSLTENSVGLASHDPPVYR